MKTVDYTDVKEAIQRIASEKWGLITEVVSNSDLESHGAYYAAINKDDYKFLSKDQLYIIDLAIEYIFSYYPEFATNEEKDTLLGGREIIRGLRTLKRDKRLRMSVN